MLATPTRLDINPPKRTHAKQVSLERFGVNGVSTILTTVVQVIDTSQYSPPSPDPAGITYLPSADRLLVADSEVNEMPIYQGKNLFFVRRGGNLADTADTTAFSDEPTGITYNPNNDHIFVSDDDDDIIYEVDPGNDGAYGTGDDIVTEINGDDFNSDDAEGVAYDPSSGHLFVVDGIGREVYDISPGNNGVFDGFPPEGDDSYTQFDVAAFGLDDPEGIAYHHLHDTLLIVDRDNLMVEVTKSGTLLHYIDITGANMNNPAGVVYAPASDNPTVYHLYIVSRGEDNDSDPNENDGTIHELAFFNSAPGVDAGNDQAVISPNDTVALDGTVIDDGLPEPPGFFTTLWSVDSGPGAVTFGDATSVDTTATFSVLGTYVLRLSADDGEEVGFDTVTIEYRLNQPPSVDAGFDQTIVLPAPANLDGTVSDDGAPDPLSTTWQQISGPAAVTFGDANLVDTTANFSQIGRYVLQLSADDGEFIISDTMTVTVFSEGTQFGTVDIPITNGLDDAEERDSGNVNLDSSDLELVQDNSNLQVVGVRFRNVAIPNGAIVTNSYIQFQTDETNVVATDLIVAGEASAQASLFMTSTNNLTNRSLTTATVNWSPPSWNIVGERGEPQRTPPLNNIVTEIVGIGGWSSGNAIAFLIAGSGERTAESYDGSISGAASFYAEYIVPSHAPPTVSAGNDQTVNINDGATLNGSANDDGLPNPPGAITTLWQQLSGPGTALFADASAVNTTVNFTQEGVYNLRLRAFDGELSAEDEVTITVTGVPTAITLQSTATAHKNIILLLPLITIVLMGMSFHLWQRWKLSRS